MHCAGNVIKMPACKQQPNRHENLTVSTKGPCQTKPFNVSEKAPEARPGSTTLCSALISTNFMSPWHLSYQDEHVCFPFASHVLFLATLR